MGGTRMQIEAQAAALAFGAPVTVRTRRNARRMTLRINAPEREIVLVLPPGVPAAKALHFLAQNEAWVAARLAALPPRRPFAEGAVIPLRGVPHRIVRETDPAAPLIAIAGGEIRVRADPRHLPRRVKDHLVALAREEFGARARDLARAIGRRPLRVGVRDTKSRWGSCSAKGALSFCWRLILAPERVIQYVVAHEVAHLAEMNHGPRFRRLVESLAPQSAEPRAWLARHRSELLCYG